MVEENIKELYFNWMCDLAMPDDHDKERYSNLLSSLYDMKFYFTIPLDENRAIDGAELRYRFGLEYGIDNIVVANKLDNKECSMLEMMVGLALRGEEHIMEDQDVGNRLSCWFLEMLESLKLLEMTNANFDERWVEYRIDALLKHEYEPNGEGGLFTVENPKKDMRKVEIWYQMMWYLNTILQ